MANAAHDSKLSVSAPAVVSLPNGQCIQLRPIGRGDVELERRFITDLSPESRRYRFLGTMTEPSDSLLRRLTTIDATRDAALGALDPDAERLIGVARFCGDGEGRAELAIAISDDWQHRGLGTLLAYRLIELARTRGIRELYSLDSEENHVMRRFAHKLGFSRNVDPDDATQVIYTMKLTKH